MSPIEKLKEVDRCLNMANKHKEKANEYLDRVRKLLDSLKGGKP